MTEVLFLSSLQGYQDSRLESMAARLKAERPDLTVKLLDPPSSAEPLAKQKLKFGPAIVIDGRVEFVGIPRYRMLVERLATVGQAAPAPRSVMRSTKPGE